MWDGGTTHTQVKSQVLEELWISSFLKKKKRVCLLAKVGVLVIFTKVKIKSLYKSVIVLK